MFKLYTSDEGQVYVGETEADFDMMPDVDVQFLAIKMDPELDGKTRAVWYRDNPGIWGEFAYYWWDREGDNRHPCGVTPDAVLDRWARKTGETDVTIADLSLDDLKSIGVKVGRNMPSPAFEAMLQTIIDDPEIP